MNSVDDTKSVVLNANFFSFKPAHVSKNLDHKEIFIIHSSSSLSLFELTNGLIKNGNSTDILFLKFGSTKFSYILFNGEKNAKSFIKFFYMLRNKM